MSCTVLSDAQTLDGDSVALVKTPEPFLKRGPSVQQSPFQRWNVSCRYAITKRTLQLFFKNRCQQKQRRKRKKVKEEEQPSTEDLQQSELLEGLVPIAPAPCPSDVLHINSLLEMVKGDEFEAATDVPVALITSQSHEAYEPAAHLTVSTPAQLP